ncbi:unnamed protein product [marine sediment metagenome]|uniref:Uncharacterized protein n=1 Tax=marine sediment metagenome TaxID=412755 RepID=X1AZM6_9ZZZZ
MPNITVREYHPEAGSLLGNISTLAFGRVTAGTTSKVKVIDVAFTALTDVGNIKLGLISAGGLVVNSNPTDVTSDGSAGNGHFGIENSSAFDSSKSSASLSRHFAGLNATATAGNSSNVSVGNRSSTISNYIYLDIELDSSSDTPINGAYKVFFDYS